MGPTYSFQMVFFGPYIIFGLTMYFEGNLHLQTDLCVKLVWFWSERRLIMKTDLMGLMNPVESHELKLSLFKLKYSYHGLWTIKIWKYNTLVWYLIRSKTIIELNNFMTGIGQQQITLWNRVQFMSRGLGNRLALFGRILNRTIQICIKKYIVIPN